jgi:hypothetical protein
LVLRQKQSEPIESSNYWESPLVVDLHGIRPLSLGNATIRLQRSSVSCRARKKQSRKNWVTRHAKEIAAPPKKRAGIPISEALEHTGTANRETESLASTIKRFRGAGLSRKGKGSA